MKSTFVILSFVFFTLSSCRKSYICECTDLNTEKKVSVKKYERIRFYSKSEAKSDCETFNDYTESYSDCNFK